MGGSNFSGGSGERIVLVLIFGLSEKERHCDRLAPRQGGRAKKAVPIKGSFAWAELKRIVYEGQVVCRQLRVLLEATGGGWGTSVGRGGCPGRNDAHEGGVCMSRWRLGGTVVSIRVG